MKTKYDWSSVPSEVKWVSTDWEGWKLEHTEKPIKNDNTMMFESEEPEGYCGYLYCHAPDKNEYKGDWEDSLEGRPNEN